MGCGFAPSTATNGISKLVRVWFSSAKIWDEDYLNHLHSVFPNPTLTNQSRAVRRFLHLKISVGEHRNRNKICRILLTLPVRACISRHKALMSSSLEDSGSCSVPPERSVCSVSASWSAKQPSGLKEHSKCWKRLSFWSNEKVAPHPRGHRICKFPISLRTWYAGKAGYSGSFLHIGHLASCFWHSFQQLSQKIRQHLCITASLHTCQETAKKKQWNNYGGGMWGFLSFKLVKPSGLIHRDDWNSPRFCPRGRAVEEPTKKNLRKCLLYAAVLMYYSWSRKPNQHL